jgi:hypothetical protein
MRAVDWTKVSGDTVVQWDSMPGLPFNELRNAGGVFGHRRRLA